MRQNVLSKNEYIINTFFYSGVTFIIYDLILFRSLKNVSGFISVVILAAMVVLSDMIELIIDLSWNRNWKSVLGTVIIPFGVYSYYQISDVLPQTFILAVKIIIGIGITCELCILTAKFSIITKKRVVCIKVKLSYVCGKCLITCLSFIIILCLLFKPAPGDNNTDDTESMINEEQIIADNMDAILRLQEFEWCKLSKEQCQEVLQRICIIEKAHLGINEDIKVVITNLEEHIAGTFDPSDFTVKISPKTLYSATNSLSTCLHEIYHGYEYCVSLAYCSVSAEYKDLYIFRQAHVSDYVHEFKNYQAASKAENEEQLERYYKQLIEIDSRKYEEARTIFYLNTISEYWNSLIKPRNWGDGIKNE